MQKCNEISIHVTAVITRVVLNEDVKFLWLFFPHFKVPSQLGNIVL